MEWHSIHPCKVLFFIITIFCHNIIVAQQNIHSGSIEWKKPISAIDPATGMETRLLFFNNAVFHEGSSFPFYQLKLPVTSPDIKLVNISFENIRSEAFPSDELRLAAQHTSLTDSILVKQTIVYETKKPYRLISFIPILKNKNSGKWERVLTFKLNISNTPSVSAVKSGATSRAYKSQSILNTGKWYKITIQKSGIYKMTFAELKSMGITNPENVRVYGNGGKMLPEIFSAPGADDLLEIPVQINQTSPGTFSDNDYVLFYGEGPVTWGFDGVKYTHSKHAFADKISYFVTSAAGGKKIAVVAPLTENPTVQVASFDGLEYHEANLNNLLRSGRTWIGEPFDTKPSYDFTYTFPSLVANEPVLFDGEFVGRSGNQTFFGLRQNNQLFGNVSISALPTLNDLADFASTTKFQANFIPASDKITLRVSFDKNGDASALGWLNYFRLTARQALALNSGQLLFRDSKSVGTGNIASFSVSNATLATQVWDITDIHNVTQVTGSLQGGVYKFLAPAGSLRGYAAFDSKTGGLTPIYPKNSDIVPNQNLHSLSNIDFVIIAHPLFLKQANELAELHRKHDNLSTIVVTPEQVFNEFSSGVPDPAAIRNFLKMLYDNATNANDAPKYLLLFGDGSYNNRDEKVDGIKNSNLILTYQSANYLSPTLSYVSDDYYGLLDDNERITTGMLDVGIGRFPVQDTIHAQQLINKVKSYMGAESHGSWRNTICFVADDEDYNIHMEQADQLATFMQTSYPDFNIEKIYLDAYHQVSTSSGSRYPDVNLAITNQINRGTLIVNYTGHGGERGLAHEQIMRQKEDIELWDNSRYPLFITATCDFSRFDDFQQTTAGEAVLLNLRGGGIALLTTTRLVYSSPNFVLNQQFYITGLSKSEDNPDFRLGDIFRITKNNSGTDINKLNFTLLGDPALKLAIPKYRVITDSINHSPAENGDTLKAYSQVIVKGRVLDRSGNRINSFNGVVYPTIFDKPREMKTLGNDSDPPFEFSLQNNVLFKGKSTVKNGEFVSSVIMPRDLDYNYGKGKISFYASDSLTDASGSCQSVVIGGLESNILPNNTGPVIRLFLNDTTFLNGGICNTTPTLLALINDENGINPGGNGIGHDIVATLDNDPTQTFVLNSYFETNIDNFRKGSVKFKFPSLSPGKHQVTFKIWDNFNNSSQATLDFTVIGENDLAFQRVYNYPNPATNYTNFFFEHNQSEKEYNITIEIFNMAGGVVNRIEKKISPMGYTSGPIFWDIKNQNNHKILPGIYLYRIILRSLNNTYISPSNKLVVIN